MSKAYEMISESLNEIIQDLEDNDGKNLRREIIYSEADKISDRETKPIPKSRRVTSLQNDLPVADAVLA